MLALEILSILLASSPWAPASWRVSLNFGREGDTPNSFDEGWGASGARLALSVPVRIQTESSTDLDDDFLGRRADTLIVEDDARFVSMKGEEKVSFVEQGAWRLSTRQSRSVGDALTVRMVIDLKDTVSRNDIVLSPQRLYLMANAWRENEVDVAKQRYGRVKQAFDLAQERLDSQLSHDSGDRRLDGTNILDTAAASIDMVALVKRRDDALFELRQGQQTLPHKSLSLIGDWPGSDEGLAIQEGSIAIKQKGGFFNPDELVVVGRWTATPMEDESEYEYYSEEGVDVEI